MLRNALAAALRNLSRNVIYASISIAGLAIGFATAILIALFIRDEFSYERFIPGHDRTYLLQSYQTVPSRAPFTSDHTIPTLAARLKLDFPQIQSTARMATYDEPAVRRGEIENIERVYWADSNIFDLLPLSTISGDLHRALENPNSVVLTQKA